MRTSLLLALVVGLAGCDSEPPDAGPLAFETLAQSGSLFADYVTLDGDQTSVAPAAVALTSREAEARFLAEYPRSRSFTGDGMEIVSPFPAIDYATHTGAVVTLGTTGSGSVRVRVDSVVARGTDAVAYTTKVLPCLYTRDFANPSVVVAVDGARRSLTFAPMTTEQSRCP